MGLVTTGLLLAWPKTSPLLGGSWVTIQMGPSLGQIVNLFTGNYKGGVTWLKVETWVLPYLG